jgi:hypothetical protein
MSAMQTRRTTLLSVAAALAASLPWLPGRARGAAVTRTLLGEDEPAAIAIAYVANARNVDPKQYPAYRRGQSCTTCALVEFGTGLQRGCTLVPGRLVMAPGWCKVWKLRGGSS